MSRPWCAGHVALSPVKVAMYGPGVSRLSFLATHLCCSDVGGASRHRCRVISITVIFALDHSNNINVLPFVHFQIVSEVSSHYGGGQRGLQRR